jgi:hypothetical protein
MAKVVSAHPGSINIALLHSFDTYIKDMSRTDLFNEYALIPNRDRYLNKSSQLKNADSIPNWLSDMVKPLITDCVDTFAHSDFADVAELTSFSRKDLSDKINAKLSELRDQYLKHDKCYDSDTLEILAKICMIYKQCGLSTYRNNVMPIICKHLGLDYAEKELTSNDADERDIAMLPFKHLVENMLLEIATRDNQWVEANYDYVVSLHAQLCNWSEYYDKNNKKGFAVTYGAYPNKLNEPSKLESLKRGLNIPEVLVNLYQSVMGRDLCKILVNEDFSSFCEFQTLSADEVAAEIEGKLEEDGFDSEYVLDIINNLDDEQWQKWFSHINDRKAELFLKQVKNECQDGIFRLMKVNDPSKLNQLADLADDVDLDEIILRGKKALVDQQNQVAEFEYKKSLGEYVENCLQTVLANRLQSELNNDSQHTVSVDNEQYGHDLVVYCDGTPVYYLEVKSRWGLDQSVMMSPLQMRTSVEKSSEYALCCVDMTGMSQSECENHNYPELSQTIGRIKCLTNIGELNSEIVKVSSCGSDDEVHIGGDYKCIVPQKVIKSYGVNLSTLIATIADKIVAHHTDRAIA